MPVFSVRSEERLVQCDPSLIKVMRRAILEYDFIVACGYRGEAEQNSAYASGLSGVRWPMSKHNKKPSVAIDVYPYPYEPNAKDYGQRQALMATHILAIASRLHVPMVWGGHWKRPYDPAHFELYRIL